MTGAVQLTDTTVRDGSTAVSHQFTVTRVREVVRELDAADTGCVPRNRSGMTVIEVTHGDACPRSTTDSAPSTRSSLN
ncbi:hypothetical protein Rhow_000793 [Rhodococcus wratislaviensis]|uniref:Uncharacterized protein n=1 Tax=Rhodococcus wratislaviensis TaxID=44752 RepID=A0A402C2P2_RHOWR|nr:hypothetical protein Rhow_000793 [Rhodococcus wratislaviensis]